MICAIGAVVLGIPTFCGADEQEPLRLGNQRELFVDHYLIDSMQGVHLMLHAPQDEGVAFRFDRPWEGPFCAYSTVIKDGDLFRLYYRGKAAATPDGLGGATCVAESSDGIRWTRPDLSLVEWEGSWSNNIILAEKGLSHNFSPTLDANPAALADQRYKALAGLDGLTALTSPDGLHWKKLSDQPVFNKDQLPPGNRGGFDSQNVAFWSPVEKRYLMFFRVWQDGIRRIGRAESQDFIHWTNVTMMQYRGADGNPAKVEQIYINQTQSYFRAPQIYISLAARFMPGRQVITEEEARAIHVNPKYFHDTSDAVFMTSRGGNSYDRTFMSAFIRPGIGLHNWVSRTMYPALNVVQTSPAEMSLYANEDYAQPTSHLERYQLRLDGFASVHAPYSGGEMTTKPITFTGHHLLLNFSTSAAGGIRVELRDAQGQPIPGFTLDDGIEVIGNELARVVKWKSGDDVGVLAGRPIRLRFVMKDADLYALRFAGN